MLYLRLLGESIQDIDPVFWTLLKAASRWHVFSSLSLGCIGDKFNLCNCGLDLETGQFVYYSGNDKKLHFIAPAEVMQTFGWPDPDVMVSAIAGQMIGSLRKRLAHSKARWGSARRMEQWVNGPDLSAYRRRLVRERVEIRQLLRQLRFYQQIQLERQEQAVPSEVHEELVLLAA